MLSPAIVALTPRGLGLAQRLAGRLGRGQVGVWGAGDRNPRPAGPAAVAGGEGAEVSQAAARGAWGQEWGAWPASFRLLDELPAKDWTAALVISDRRHPRLSFPSVTYR